MSICLHQWVPLAPQAENCLLCGAIRQPPTPYVHLQSGAIVRPAQTTIPTTTIHGEPVEWPPITEGEETHE